MFQAIRVGHNPSRPKQECRRADIVCCFGCVAKEAVKGNEVRMCGRVARGLDQSKELGAPHVGFTCGGFDFSCFLPVRVFNPPHQSSLIRSLAGDPGVRWQVKLGAPHVGFTCGDFDFSSFLPLRSFNPSDQLWLVRPPLSRRKKSCSMASLSDFAPTSSSPG